MTTLLQFTTVLWVGSCPALEVFEDSLLSRVFMLVGGVLGVRDSKTFDKIKANISVSVGKQTDGNIVGSLWGS